MPTYSENHHTIAVLVENRSGVLARVSDLFARRGFNIVTLTVAPTTDERFSYITVVVDVESSPLDQVIKQLFKLINVVQITELIGDLAIERELLVATVSCDENRRAALSELVDRHYGKILSEADALVIFSVEANPSQVDRLENELGAFDVVNIQRSGRVALPKIGHQPRLHRAEVE